MLLSSSTTSNENLHYVYDLQRLDALLENKPDLNLKDSHNDTALALSVKNGKTAVAVRLLNAGASTKDIDGEGNTLVHLALKVNREDIFRYAIENLQQDINLRDLKGLTPLQSLLGFIPHYLSDKTLENVLLHPLLDKNVLDENGNSLLMRFVRNSVIPNKLYDMVYQHLGFLANQPNQDNDIPLHVVSKYSSENVTRLLPLTANLMAPNNKGKRAIIRCFQKKAFTEKDIEQEEARQWALQVPISQMNFSNLSGNNLFHACAKKGLIKALKVFTEQGADVLALNRHGFSPAFYALVLGKLDCYFHLAKLGSPVTQVMLQTEQALPSKEMLRKAAACKFGLLYPTTLDEKKLAVEICMNAVLFQRWGNTSDLIAYRTTIGRLIMQYGEEVFITACKDLFKSHLSSLDLTNIEEQGPHSDLNSPYNLEYMTVVRHLLNETHPTVRSMRDFGYCVNLKTIFGDLDFWKICSEQHPSVYEALVEAVQGWPETLENHYHYHRKYGLMVKNFCPKKVFQENFPEAYKFLFGGDQITQIESSNSRHSTSDDAVRTSGKRYGISINLDEFRF